MKNIFLKPINLIGGFFYFCSMENLFNLFYNSTGISTDTRRIKKDSLFICLSGENFNGNTFANEALNLGAKFVIADQKDVCDEKLIFFVESSLNFLQKLANHHRNKFKIPIIGITGSNGKTTSKELIYSVLSQKYVTLATEGNLNNHIGVPLTLLNLNKTHELAIVEMGANKFKDIEELCLIAEPTIGLITNIGKAHLEGFINFEGVLKTKKELYDSIEKNNGFLFFNSDDEILKSILPPGINTFSYGETKDSDVFGELTHLDPFVNLIWKCKEFSSYPLKTNLVGKYNFYNFLAAISFGVHFKVDFDLISSAIENYVPTNNRSQVSKTTLNTLILDAYNANPTSMKSAIDSFDLIQANNKLAILGDMFELGLESSLEHKKIIDLIKEKKIQTFFIGERFYEFRTTKNIDSFYFITKDEFLIFLSTNQLKDKIILLKGSRGIGLEKLVEKL